jgi:hypothetical protein
MRPTPTTSTTLTPELSRQRSSGTSTASGGGP